MTGRFGLWKMFSRPFFLPAARSLSLPSSRLVLPLAGIPGAGFGLDVVPPHVFGALAVGPDVLAGDRTRVATEALVQVEDH